MHVAQILIESKGLKLYGDEIFLAGRCIGWLNPALPFVIRTEAIELLEGPDRNAAINQLIDAIDPAVDALLASAAGFALAAGAPESNLQQNGLRQTFTEIIQGLIDEATP